MFWICQERVAAILIFKSSNQDWTSTFTAHPIQSHLGLHWRISTTKNFLWLPTLNQSLFLGRIRALQTSEVPQYSSLAGAMWKIWIVRATYSNTESAQILGPLVQNWTRVVKDIAAASSRTFSTFAAVLHLSSLAVLLRVLKDWEWEKMLAMMLLTTREGFKPWTLQPRRFTPFWWCLLVLQTKSFFLEAPMEEVILALCQSLTWQTYRWGRSSIIGNYVSQHNRTLTVFPPGQVKSWPSWEMIWEIQTWSATRRSGARYRC